MARGYENSFYASVAKRAETVANLVAAQLVSYVPVKSLIDVGCGSGTWTRAFLREGVDRARGYDLPAACNLANAASRGFRGASFEEVDFEQQAVSFSGADLSICVEVLEHLRSETAISVLYELTQNSDLILFSAAQPGQGGTNHVNERPLSYWLLLFADAGFVAFDMFRPDLVTRTDVPRYYSLNLFLLARKGSKSYEHLAALAQPSNPSHPTDFRTHFEKVRFFLVGLLPTWLVSLLSKLVRY